MNHKIQQPSMKIFSPPLISGIGQFASWPRFAIVNYCRTIRKPALQRPAPGECFHRLSALRLYNRTLLQYSQEFIPPESHRVHNRTQTAWTLQRVVRKGRTHGCYNQPRGPSQKPHRTEGTPGSVSPIPSLLFLTLTTAHSPQRRLSKSNHTPNP